MPATHRIAPGEYEVTDHGRTVSISHYDSGWVARAEWDKYLYSDPHDTLREAKTEALGMLR